MSGKSLLIPATIAGRIQAALSQDETCARELYRRMAEHAAAYGVDDYAGALRGVVNALLGNWDTTLLVPGDYLLRLVVADSQNQLLPACVVSVRVVAPPQ